MSGGPPSRPLTTASRRTRRALDAAERARAARFHFERDRRAFIVSHGILRSLLSRYLGASAGRVAYSDGERAKPRLAGGDLRFNMAHSGGVALYAFARDFEVGVDVEEALPDFDWEEVAGAYFAPREIALIRAAGRRARRAFYRMWTAKEAILKASGVGIGALDLCVLPDAVLDDAAPLPLHVAAAAREYALWTLPMEGERAAALAAETSNAEVTLRALV